MQVPVETDESMPSVTERPMPSKGRIVAQPGPVWKTNCISTGVATRCPNQCTSTSFEVWRYQRATNCCFARACVMLPLPGPVPSRPALLECGGPLNPVSSSHKAEGPPWLVDARHRSSPKLQLAKAQEQSMPESQARGEMSQDVCCMRGCSQGKNGAEESHPEGLLLTGYPSPMPVALAARFVSWNVCVWISYLPSPGRSKAQRRLVVGSSRTVSNAATAP